MGGAGPIPLSEVLAYAQYTGMTSLEERARFLKFISMMDNVFMAHQARKSETKKSSR